MGKTTVAMALALAYKKANRKTLLISLEHFTSIDSILNYDTHKSLAELVFEKGSLEKFSSILNSVLNTQNGLTFLNPFTHTKDYLDIELSDLEKFLNNLKSVNLFDVIILDLDSAYNEFNKTILQHSEKISIVSTTCKTSIDKINFMFSDKLFKEEFLEKSNIVINKNYNKNAINKIGHCSVKANLSELESANILDVSNYLSKEIDVSLFYEEL